MKGLIVELEGDEMAQVLWNSVKQQVLKPQKPNFMQLITPYVDLKLHTVDLGILNRDKKDDLPVKDAI